MLVPIIIWVKNVEYGKSHNWLQFEAFCDFYNKTTVYKIEYCGTEIHSNIPLKDNQEEQFMSLLQNDYGYAPFSISKCKSIIGQGKGYKIYK